MTCPRLLPASLVLAALTLSATAHASGPAGVWGLVDEVTLTPNESNPQVMRIDGLFMIAKQDPDFPQYPGYSVPQYGYIHYACLAEQLDTCAMEWKELLALAGTADNCRGWGDNSFEINGTVRPANEPMVEEQEVYPVSMGIMTGVSPCDALKAWMTENPDPDTDGSTGEPSSTGDSSSTGTGETGASTSGEASTGTGAAEGSTGTTGAPGTSESNDSTISDTAVPLTTATPTDGGDGSDTTAGTGTTTTDPGADDNAKGCSCDGRAQPGPGALLLLAGLALVRRRRSA